jgi:GNAT superfamily N-acetyltransferase
MTPGFHAESVPVDVGGSPAMRVCTTVSAMFSHDERLSGNVTLAVTPQGPRDLWVSMLHANRRGTGVVARLLDALCLLCDMHGVVVRLQAVSLRSTLRNAGDALDQDALRAFYERRGFVTDPAGRDQGMIRRPCAADGADRGDDGRMRILRTDRRRSNS